LQLKHAKDSLRSSIPISLSSSFLFDQLFSNTVKFTALTSNVSKIKRAPRKDPQHTYLLLETETDLVTRLQQGHLK